jgi:hypothetical protein
MERNIRRKEKKNIPVEFKLVDNLHLNHVTPIGPDRRTRKAAIDEHGLVLDPSIRAHPVVMLGNCEGVLPGLAGIGHVVLVVGVNVPPLLPAGPVFRTMA